MKPQPKYQKISIDIAELIINKSYKKDDKFLSTATLASMYKVSNETIRKAILLLKNFEVLTATQKNGIRILDSEKAMLYLNLNKGKTNITKLLNNLSNLSIKKEKLNEEFNITLNELIDLINSDNYTEIICPREIQIKKNSPLIGKSISECNFWQNTKCTIISYKKNHKTEISPDPSSIIEENTFLSFIEKEKDSYQKMINYISFGSLI